MRITTFFLLLIGMLSCTSKSESLDSKSIIQKSIKYYDPNNLWSSMDLKLHIQEPRLANPHRYSIVRMNNKDDSFQLLRNRDSSISKHIINKSGKTITLLDDKIIKDSSIIKKYRLEPKRNLQYQKSYYHLLGLPMSLSQEIIKRYGYVSKESFNGKSCYKIELVLKEKIFSEYWSLYIDSKNYTIEGLDIIFPDNKERGERLYFGGTVNINGLKLSRMKHWHSIMNNEYLGSDVIVKTMR